jgi:AraC-like DNA-binding protein
MANRAQCSTLEFGGRIHVLQANYQGRAFAPHWHEEHAIGLIDSGIEQFDYRGATHRAVAGQLVFMDAGEVHTGEAFDERGFGFKMLYIPESSFQVIAPSLTARHFPDPVVSDVSLAQTLIRFHLGVSGGATRLALEDMMDSVLCGLLPYTKDRQDTRTSQSDSNLRVAQAFLHDHLFDDVCLDELALAAGMSKFHFLRAFKSSFGVPPHAYQLQARILRSKIMLERLVPVAEVATRCGFFDQSHFHRVFRNLVGTTPGAYAEQFRPIRGTRNRVFVT